MAKREVSMTYLTALDAFKELLAHAKATSPEFEKALTIGVHLETGRKFDKILISYLYKDAKGYTQASLPDVLYFVARSSYIERNGTVIKEGAIFGKKSDVAPNFRWYYGDIFSAGEWNWSDKQPVPNDPSAYVVKSHYGDYKHYEKIGKMPATA